MNDWLNALPWKHFREMRVIQEILQPVELNSVYHRMCGLANVVNQKEKNNIGICASAK